MSEHTWVLEHLASYAAGGLDDEEREQLEEHVSDCGECARALAEVRALDRKLEGLFAGVRPNPALEDRSIQWLRRVSGRPGTMRLSGRGKVLAAVAATVFFAFVGAGMSAMLEEGPAGSSFLSDKALVGKFVFDDSKSMRHQIALGIHNYELKTAETLAEEIRAEPRQIPRTAGGFPEDVIGTVWGTTNGPIRGSSSNGINFSPDGRRLSAQGRIDPSDMTNMAIRPPPSLGFFKPGEVFAEQTAKGRKSARDKNGEFGVVLGLPPSVNLGWSEKRGDKEQVGGEGKPQKDMELAVEAARKKLSSIKENGIFHGLNDADIDPAFVKGNIQEQNPPAPPVTRRVIRSGDIEFEITSFDDAVATVTRLVAGIKGGFVATINSDKLPNGKVRGAVVVRVPPDSLDRFVLDLRKELGKVGELKGQRIGSQDITKQYTDLESRLRAARTMEERLLKIIRDGKGEIKDLVAAEKELGVWRTKIEETEGELRYYSNLVSLSTLTVNLTEKDIREAVAIDERERVQAGIQVEDVDLAHREALKAVAEAKGRVTKSELKQQKEGQFSAVVHFEVEPEKAGPMRDRLKQLGNMVRLEIDRVQTAQGGGTAPRDGKVKHGPTQFFISLYNLANVEPRETQTLKVAAPEVTAAFHKLREALAKVKGHEVNAQLNEQDRQNINGQLDFDVRRADEGTLQVALSGAGEVLSRHVGRKPQGENVTDAKVLFKVELLPATAIPPREMTTLAIEVQNVDAALSVLNAQMKEVEGRLIDKKVGQERNGRVTARVVLDVPLAAESELVAKLKSAGVVRVQEFAKFPQSPEGKFAVARLVVTLSNAELLVPGDEGLWTQVWSGLSVSLRGLALSVKWLIFGVLFLLPWALLLYAIVWLGRRLWGKETAALPASTGNPSVPH